MYHVMSRGNAWQAIFADGVPESQSLRSLDVGTVIAAVSASYDVELVIFGSCGNGYIARAVAAWLARRLTLATWREGCVPLDLEKKPGFLRGKNPAFWKEARLF